MTRHARLGWLTALLAGLALLVSACGGGAPAASEGGATGGTSEAGSQTPIKIGFVASATGNSGSLGDPEQKTLDLFKDQIAEIDGHPIEWIFRDDQSDPTQAVVAVKGLIEEDQVAAVVCCTISPSSMAILDTVQGDQVPNISMAAAATIVEPASERHWVFKTPQNDALMIDILTDDMVARGIQKVAFIGFDDSYGQSGLAEFQKAAQAKGIEIVDTEKFQRTDTDVTAQATQMAAKNPDAFLIWAIPPGADVAQHAIKSLGLKQPIYQSHGVANAQFIQLGGADVEGTLLPAGKLLIADYLPDSDPQKKVLLDYRSAYEGKYGAGTANTFGGHAWDAMFILKAAIAAALEGGADPSDIASFRAALRDAIEKTSEFVGVSGIFTYSPDDHAGLDKRAAAMVEIQDGKWVPAQK
ncbi:MAG: ABC transporter substrate-binding protein [Clostridia bacterium]|nr:ABC transporter substrate-binding protein [Clostridia bacterium]